MKVIKPCYMEEFECIGGKCEDTCCAGWYIAIDADTLRKYKKVKDKMMKARLDKEVVEKRKNVSLDHAAKIKLKNGRCAFLDKEGWCDIYKNLGPSYLSHTCTLYPRGINRVNGILEYSLIMSCPEAARKILLRKEPITFYAIEGSPAVYTISADIEIGQGKKRWQDYLMELREVYIAILQDRKLGFEERMGNLRILSEILTNAINKGDIKRIPSLIEKSTIPKESGVKNQSQKEELEKLEAARSIGLAAYLKYLYEEDKVKSTRYKECLEKIYMGLKLKTPVDLDKAEESYSKGKIQYYKPFLLKKGYILENYFINYVFERCIPLDGETPRESFERMYLYYELIRLQLIALGNVEEGISDEAVVKLIQSFSKVFDHNDVFINEMLYI